MGKRQALKVPPCRRCGRTLLKWGRTLFCGFCTPVSDVARVSSGLAFCGEVRADKKAYVFREGR